MKDLERLQNKIELMASRITIKDISQLSAIGASQRGSQNFWDKDFLPNQSLRQTIISNETQNERIGDLEKELDGY